MKIRIGRFDLGASQISMVIVFITLSVCAVIAAFHQYRSEWSMPLHYIIFLNETLALAATLCFGILLHFILALKSRQGTCKKES